MARMREGIRKKAEGWGVSRGSSAGTWDERNKKKEIESKKINWPERFNIKSYVYQTFKRVQKIYCGRPVCFKGTFYTRPRLV